MTTAGGGRCIGAFFSLGTSTPAWIIGDTFLVRLALHSWKDLPCAHFLSEKCLLRIQVQSRFSWFRTTVGNRSGHEQGWRKCPDCDHRKRRCCRHQRKQLVEFCPGSSRVYDLAIQSLRRRAIRPLPGAVRPRYSLLIRDVASTRKVDRIGHLVYVPFRVFVLFCMIIPCTPLDNIGHTSSIYI